MIKKNVLFSVFLVIFTCFSQEKSVFVDIGAVGFNSKNSKTTISYFIGANWKTESKRLTDEVYLFLNHYSTYKLNQETENFDNISYGKGIDFESKHFFVRPSLNAGIFYWNNLKLTSGFSNSYGIQFNPRCQLGTQFGKVRISMILSYSIGTGLKRVYDPNGIILPGTDFDSKYKNVSFLNFYPSISWRI